MSKANRISFAVLVIAGAICLLLALFLHNWTLHARLNLWLRGCSFCHIESAENLSSLPFRPPGFVAKLVYRNHKCVGYLDRYGMFLLPSDNSFDQANRDENVVLDMTKRVFGQHALQHLTFALRRGPCGCNPKERLSSLRPGQPAGWHLYR